MGRGGGPPGVPICDELCCLFFLFIVTSVFFTGTGVNLYPVPPFLSELDVQCSNIGFASGCSGCEIGTQQLCRYVGIPQAELVDGINPIRYMCLGKDTAKEIVAGEYAFYASDLCPKDVADEKKFAVDLSTCDNGWTSLIDLVPTALNPLLPFTDLYIPYTCELGVLEAIAMAASQNGVSLPIKRGTAGTPLPDIEPELVPGFLNRRESSLIFSSHHDSKNAEFPSEPWIVDRTSAWEDAGSYRLHVFGGDKPKDLRGRPFYPTCAELNGPDILELTDLLSGCAWSERQRTCASMILSAYYSVHCPTYGKAYTGLCSSTFTNIVEYCLGAPRGALKEGLEEFIDEIFVPPTKRSAETSRSSFTNKKIKANQTFAMLDKKLAELTQKAIEAQSTSKLGRGRAKRAAEEFSAKSETSQEVYTGFEEFVRAAILPLGRSIPMVPLRMDLLMSIIASDDDPYCLRTLPVKVSGEVEKKLGLHKSIEEIEKEIIYWFWINGVGTPGLLIRRDVSTAEGIRPGDLGGPNINGWPYCFSDLGPLWDIFLLIGECAYGDCECFPLPFCPDDR